MVNRRVVLTHIPSVVERQTPLLRVKQRVLELRHDRPVGLLSKLAELCCTCNVAANVRKTQRQVDLSPIVALHHFHQPAGVSRDFFQHRHVARHRPHRSSTSQRRRTVRIQLDRFTRHFGASRTNQLPERLSTLARTFQLRHRVLDVQVLVARHERHSTLLRVVTDNVLPPVNLILGLGQVLEDAVTTPKDLLGTQTGPAAVHTRNLTRRANSATPANLSTLQQLLSLEQLASTLCPRRRPQHGTATSTLDRRTANNRDRINKLLHKVSSARDQVEQRVVLDRVVLVLIKRVDHVQVRCKRLTKRALIVDLPRLRIRLKIKQRTSAVLMRSVHDRKQRAQRAINQLLHSPIPRPEHRINNRTGRVTDLFRQRTDQRAANTLGTEQTLDCLAKQVFLHRVEHCFGCTAEIAARRRPASRHHVNNKLGRASNGVNCTVPQPVKETHY